MNFQPETSTKTFLLTLGRNALFSLFRRSRNRRLKQFSRTLHSEKPEFQSSPNKTFFCIGLTKQDTQRTQRTANGLNSPSPRPEARVHTLQSNTAVRSLPIKTGGITAKKKCTHAGKKEGRAREEEKERDKKEEGMITQMHCSAQCRTPSHA